jgi:nitronate monooxygenase
LGVVGASRRSLDGLTAEIARTRALTSKPFGVNVILATAPKGVVDLCIEKGVPVLGLFRGHPSSWVDQAHRHGVKIVVQLGSVDEAQTAARAGVNAVILQGIEAGGHVRATTSLWANLPGVVDAVRRVPVLAAGGIATGRGLVAALSLGAQGASLGTRFLAAREPFVATEYKERIVKARAEDTVYCELFDGGRPAPHRVIRNKAVAEWETSERPAPGGGDDRRDSGTRQRPGAGAAVRRVHADGGGHWRPRILSVLLRRVLHARERHQAGRRSRARDRRGGRHPSVAQGLKHFA